MITSKYCEKNCIKLKKSNRVILLKTITVYKTNKGVFKKNHIPKEEIKIFPAFKPCFKLKQLPAFIVTFINIIIQYDYYLPIVCCYFTDTPVFGIIFKIVYKLYLWLFTTLRSYYGILSLAVSGHRILTVNYGLGQHLIFPRVFQHLILKNTKHT